MQQERLPVLQDGRFLLLESIGRGGMGTVYRAFDRACQSLVALKVATDPGGAGPGHPFSVEYETWSRLDHPNIVRALEFGLAESGPIAPGSPYLVLEHVAGAASQAALGRDRMDGAEAERLAGQLLQALAHVHASGFVHRDVKPGNVLVSPNGSETRCYKLTDFGLAAPTGARREAGTFSGSFHYTAPESLLGMPLDGRADLYSLGILLYRMTVGAAPAHSSQPEEILRWHLTGPPADPALRRPALSGRLSRFVRRLTQRDRGLRPDSASAALALLGRRLVPRPGLESRARARRAEWRLALDAARLGGRRVYRLAALDSESTTRREVAVAAQTRGVRFHRLAGDETSVCRMVIALLSDLGSRAPGAIRRHRLEHCLPLTVVGDQPVIDATRAGSGRQRARGTLRAARLIASFVLRCAELRPAVVWAAEGLAAGSLSRQLADELTRRAEMHRGPLDGGGGLLVVVPAEGRVRIRQVAAPRSPDAARDCPR